MPTVAQMAALGDTLTGATLLQPANNTFCPHERSNSLDSVVQAAYGVDTMAKNPAGSSLGEWNNTSLSATPEIVSGSLMAYKA